MIIATTIAQVRAQVAAWKKEGLTVGLVPTMGYLHEGHASLVDEAVRQCDRVVASDFVNPTQFGPNEDLEAYPRDFDRDCALLEEHGCAMVFRQMVRDLSYGIEIVGCPIVREADGLAKSSRNTYLSEAERQAALVLSESVFLGQKMVAEGETDANKIVAAMTEHIQAQPLAKIDYVSAVDGVTMDPVDRISGTVLVAMAVYIGKTRLIDNFIVEGK